jgi:hypothetical protein
MLRLIENCYNDIDSNEDTAVISMFNIPRFEGALPQYLPFLTFEKSKSVIVVNLYAIEQLKVMTGDKIGFIKENNNFYVFKDDTNEGFELKIKSKTKNKIMSLQIANINLMRYLNEELSIDTTKSTYRIYISEKETIINNVKCYKFEKIHTANKTSTLIKE